VTLLGLTAASQLLSVASKAKHLWRFGTAPMLFENPAASLRVVLLQLHDEGSQFGRGHALLALNQLEHHAGSMDAPLAHGMLDSGEQFRKRPYCVWPPGHWPPGGCVLQHTLSVPNRLS